MSMDRNDSLLNKFDQVTKELKEIAEKKHIDLARIRISNKEAERYRRRYVFYN